MATLELKLAVMGIGLALVFFGLDQLDIVKGKFKKFLGLCYLILGIIYLLLITRL